MDSLEDAIKASIRDIPDFPKPGILFKDITPILSDPQLLRRIIASIADRYRSAGVDVVVGMESRGFLFGTPLALELNAAFVPARKPGKLPYHSVGVEYNLEYGTAKLEVHIDAVKPGQKVLIIDDLLATGGTAGATVKLIEQLEGEVVAAVFVVELDFLKGRDALDVEVFSLSHY